MDSRQDTILANVNSSQGYFYNSLIQGNFDYIWGGGNLFITNCEFRTIPTASSYNLAAPRTDNGTAPGAGPWVGWGVNQYVSNGLSFVNCQLTRSSSTVSNITLADANGTANGISSFIFCNIDVSNVTSLGYIAPVSSVLSNMLVWEYGNSNLNGSAAVTLGAQSGAFILTNFDARLQAATNATVWLNGWTPQLAPNIITNPVGTTVAAGSPFTLSVVATGIPDPTYQWYQNNNEIVGANAATYVVAAATGNDNGTYHVPSGTRQAPFPVLMQSWLSQAQRRQPASRPIRTRVPNLWW